MSEVESEIYYRYQERVQTPYDHDIDGELIPYPSLATIKAVLYEYHVIKRTPKGVWITEIGGSSKRFVLNCSVKKFAHPSPQLAKESFIIRKKKQISILKKKLNQASKALESAVSGDEITYVI